LDDYAPKANPVFSGSISMGRKANTTTGNLSTAIGSDVTADAAFSHAEGVNTTASGLYGSHAEGSGNIASGSSSHAEGYVTVASNSSSHAEGSNTIASGAQSHAEGETTTAAGAYTHTEGRKTYATGEASHAEGLGNGTNSYNYSIYPNADPTKSLNNRTASSTMQVIPGASG